jgi:hypothetical protein
MSPEQAKGGPLDHRTDQFSVGLILHEMATGLPTFRRDTPAQVLAAVIERDPEPLRRLRPDVPEALQALVMRCLQKDPTQRFAKTDELAAELAALVGRSRTGSLAEVAPVSRPSASPLSAEVLLAGLLPSRAQGPLAYHVKEGDRVRSYGEERLVRLIRRGKLSGAEMVRQGDEEQWRPLYESRVFRREVPLSGDPRNAVRLRVLRGLAGHFTGFIIVGVVMYSTQGHLPFWMAIWGVVLGMQALRSAPTALALLRRRDRDVLPAADGPALPVAPPPALLPAVPTPIAQEAARVRALIEQRGGSDTPRLLAEVDGILKLMAELGQRQTDLEEQTSDREREALAQAIAGARARLERADLAQDRRLFERQLEVVEGRQEAIVKAMRVLERLRVRRELAEHQLKQLRLDLSRGAASGLDVPELSSRLQFIRYEVDAKEEVADIAADRTGP